MWHAVRRISVPNGVERPELAERALPDVTDGFEPPGVISDGYLARDTKPGNERYRQRAWPQTSLLLTAERQGRQRRLLVSPTACD